ncbi:MAG: acyltransferase family protein [Sphingopyxis sp.]
MRDKSANPVRSIPGIFLERNPIARTTEYRADIDGLRGIAILAVVACHINLPFAAGGFVGVDIFFVISGFLITRLLADEYDAHGRIGLADFYARRVRRLLPPLVLVVAATLVAGFLWLLPDEQVALARSAIMALLFVANIHFWTVGTGYFEPASTLLPLQHLWTLGVEEQFYLLWPLAFVGTAALARRRNRPVLPALRLVLIAAVAASLALAIVQGPSRAAFFLLPARAWELGAGCLLAMAPPLSVARARWLAPLGVTAILLAILVYDAHTPFPSFRAALPVVGSVALIAAGAADPRGVVPRLLSQRWIAGLGKVSYGWSLWHWPLLAFVRIQWGGGIHVVRDTGLVLLALLLAIIMYHRVEMPIRERRVAGFGDTTRSLASGGALLVAGLALAAALWVWAARPSPAGSLMAQYRTARSGAVRDFPFCNGPAPCASGAPAGGPALLLWGDSHAAQLGHALDLAGRQAGIHILTRTEGGCAPGGSPLGVRRGDPRWMACAAFEHRVRAELAGLRGHRNLRTLLFAGGWDARQAGWERQLAADVDAARRLGLRVIIARDVPLHSRDVLRCTVRRGADSCAEPRAAIERRAAAVDRALDEIATQRPDVRLWSPLDRLCPHDRCPAAIDGRLLYRNQGHLTLDGSAYLAPALQPVIG